MQILHQKNFKKIGCFPVDITMSRGNLNIPNNIKEIYSLFKLLLYIKPDIF